MQKVNNSSSSQPERNGSSSFEPELAYNLGNVLVESLLALIANASGPAALSSLPTFGPAIMCLVGLYGSAEVQNSIDYAKKATRKVEDAVNIKIPTTSDDACR